MDLANKVKKRREELGWSQEELSARMGYSSRTSINKIENGRACSQKIIARLAEALDVSIAYLMDWGSEADNEKKSTADDDGLSESVMKLVEFAKTVPEDKAALILQVMKSIVEAD